MKTAMQKAINDLRQAPLEMVSQKAISEWLEACFLEKEKEQIIEANTASIDNERLTSGEIHRIGERYYNQTFNEL